MAAATLALAPDEYAGFTMTLMRMLAFMPEEFPQTRPPSTPAPAAAINAGGSAADRERGSDAQVKSSAALRYKFRHGKASSDSHGWKRQRQRSQTLRQT